MELVFKPDPNNKFGAIREIANIRFNDEYGAMIATGEIFSSRYGATFIDTGYYVKLTRNGVVIDGSKSYYLKTIDELTKKLLSLEKNIQQTVNK